VVQAWILAVPPHYNTERSSEKSRTVRVVAFNSRIALLTVFVACTPVGPAGLSRAWAQPAPVPPKPLYPIPRFNEDWSHLRDASTRDDAWDAVKFVPLSRDGRVFLSLGGEGREAYERFGNQNWGLTAPDPSGYWLQRGLFHADLHVSSRVRVWGELSSSVEAWRVGGPRPVVDEDKAAVHQAFIDVTAHAPSGSLVLVRAGRQELAFGSGRMVALREGTNVPLSFDGLRTTARAGGWLVDGILAKPVATRPGVFDDETDHHFTLWGLYSSRSFARRAKQSTADLYYFGIDRLAGRFDQGTAHERRHTIGARIWRRDRWAYDAETMYQFGEFGSGRIRAWRIAAEGSYHLTAARWQPQLGLGFDVATGNKNPRSPDLQTFNALFQSGTYSGRAQILGPANTIRLEPSIALLPAPHVTVSAGWGFYWRQSINDGLYGIAGNLIVPSNGVTGRYEGSRPIAEVDWQITRHFSVYVNYIYVFNGPFERASLPRSSATLSYLSPWIVYRF
jgi:hypothetical protein